MNRKLVPFALLLATTPLVAGCPNTANNSVSGSVSYKDKPVTGGQIKLHYPDKKVFEIALKPDGSFETTGVPTGTATVTVETEHLKNMPKIPGGLPKDGPPKDAPKDVKMPTLPDTSLQPVYVPIPSKYSDPAQSKLTLEVKTGVNKQNLVLTD